LFLPLRMFLQIMKSALKPSSLQIL